jgi:hypothetical protein
MGLAQEYGEQTSNSYSIEFLIIVNIGRERVFNTPLTEQVEEVDLRSWFIGSLN